MDFSWQNADHQIVRELGWSLFSPSILEISFPPSQPAWQLGEDEEARHILSALDQNPAPLQAFINNLKDRRLGAHFEALWHFFLDRHSFYQLLASNKQILEGKKTLGALDFLLEDHYRQQIIHLELAVKFYLYLPDASGSGLEKWIGPNPDDNLAIKYQHLINHQLPLSSTPEALTTFRKLGLPKPDLQVAIVKGYLFSPLERREIPEPPVRYPHLTGIWLRRADLFKLERQFADYHWQIIDKQHWLDPVPPPAGSGWMSLQKQEIILSGAGFPQLLAGQPARNKGGVSGESVRLFVVPDDWPD